MRTRIYNGALLCHTSNCCPVVDHDEEHKTVTIHDPSKPENGSFTMTTEEWNLLAKNAKEVPCER